MLSILKVFIAGPYFRGYYGFPDKRLFLLHHTVHPHDVHFENYLTKLTKKHCSTLLKFSLSNHRLPVETGRWENIPSEERKCNLCEKSDIGEEFHYLFVCNHFKLERKHFLRLYFYKSPNIIKFKELLSTKNINFLIKLSSFVGIIIRNSQALIIKFL